MFFRYGGNGRVVRVPAWGLVLGGLAALALVMTLVIVAAGVALVAVPVLLGAAWLTRLFAAKQVGPVPRDMPRQAPHRDGPVIIDATYEDVTGRRG